MMVHALQHYNWTQSPFLNEWNINDKAYDHEFVGAAAIMINDELHIIGDYDENCVHLKYNKTTEHLDKIHDAQACFL